MAEHSAPSHKEDRFNLEDPEPSETSQPTRFGFASYGLSVRTQRIRDNTFPIPVDKRVAEMDFIPVGQSTYIPEIRSKALGMAIKGFDKLFEFFDYLQLKGADSVIPEYLVGKTNERMARFARRIGFQISQTSDGYWRVYGETSIIRESYMREISKYEKRGFLSRLAKRSPLSESDSDLLPGMALGIPLEIYLIKKVLTGPKAKLPLIGVLALFNGMGMGYSIYRAYSLLPSGIRNRLARGLKIGKVVKRRGYSYSLS